MNTFVLCKLLINSPRFYQNEKKIRTDVDIFLVVDRITQKEYQELTDLMDKRKEKGE